MLVLTRKPGQSIIINDNIEVTILEVKGEAIRIGVEAPRDVTIYRHEIYEEIRKENLRTVQQSSLADISIAMDMMKSLPIAGKNFKIEINPDKKNDKK